LLVRTAAGGHCRISGTAPAGKRRSVESIDVTIINIPDEQFQADERLQGLRGREVLEAPLLNKGSAFTEGERRALGLLGLLPPHVSTPDEQLARAYENFQRKTTDLERYIFLASLQDRNETLFYMLLQRHVAEMMPIVYTPTVGEGCRSYSHIYRRPRGLFMAYPQQHDMDAILANAPVAAPEVIVVTDGERILGLGDLGVGGMGIPVGKLTLYTLCAGIHPATTLPILLDVGTNNEELLRDPLYLGWRHGRITGDRYDAFIDAFVAAVKRRFPRVLLQWEDFSKGNAARMLARYRDELCTFNDDIQGTGAVTLAGLLVAMRRRAEQLGAQRIVILGAGSSAIGISDQLVTAMIAEGLSDGEACSRIWLVDSQGLVHDGRPSLEASKARYARARSELAAWNAGDRIDLEVAVRQVHPTILIGTSAQAGAFTEAIIREMASAVEHPVLFPLSNPTAKAEATPADLLEWTGGRAVVATGSPFPDVVRGGQATRIGQCNNAFIFPGVGLGIVASGARRVTDGMFVAAARALADWSAQADGSDALYPRLEAARAVSRSVALAVARQAQRDEVAEPVPQAALARQIDATMWQPAYPRYS
jgi:malate dehydrogenase (oxaloacetate-decarboxylating)